MYLVQCTYVILRLRNGISMNFRSDMIWHDLTHPSRRISWRCTKKTKRQNPSRTTETTENPRPGFQGLSHFVLDIAVLHLCLGKSQVISGYLRFLVSFGAQGEPVETQRTELLGQWANPQLAGFLWFVCFFLDVLERNGNGMERNERQLHWPWPSLRLTRE